MTTMPTYRPDIEGLRAIAVVLVILYHYQFPGVSGGFAGVDVFFVISGFVITRMLRERMQDGRFRFGDFYRRRVLRLIPVYLAVSTITFLAIAPFYLDDDFYLFSKSWLYALVGLSNFHFHAELSQYFSPDSATIPLLHTWSLAVEEQFYFLWPAALLLLTRLPGGRQRPLFTLVWLLALGLSAYLARHHASLAYYLLPARVFELMLGAGVALYGVRTQPLPRPLAEALAWTGLALILATSLLLTGQHPFPGWNALPPTLGTALLLHAGSANRTSLSRLLSLPPMVFLGGISYSLYLWHWPPIALMHYQLIEITWPLRLGLVALILPLSWLSWRLVEQRFRYRPWSLRRTLVTFVLCPAVAIWLVQVTLRTADDLSFRIPEERRELYRIIAQNNPADLYKSCFKGHPERFDTSSRCRFGQAGPEEPNAILIGDSHAMALLGFVEELIDDQALNLLVVSRASTPFLLAEDMQALEPDPDKTTRSRALQQYLAQRPMTVFVGAYWNAYLSRPDMHEAFLRAIDWLLRQGHRVVVLEGVPELPSAMHAQCLLKNMASCDIDADPVREREAAFRRFRAEAEARWPQLQWLSPARVLCNESTCHTELDGLPLYRDESHLNHPGSREIGRRYMDHFNSIGAPYPSKFLNSK